MATKKEYAQYIVDQINENLASVRAMFGEFALYYDGVVVGLICDNTLFIKITASNQTLLNKNEKGPAYPGAKDSYIVDESQTEDREILNEIINNAYDDLLKIKNNKKKTKKRK